MQLKLFTRKESRTIHIGRPRMVRKKITQASQPSHNLTLWAQQPDIEKEMALLFLDIRNFTPLVENYVAMDVVHIVKKLFSNFQSIIRKHHGRIIETSGDGFYAAFGFDSSIRQAVNDAVLAGSSILETLDLLNETSFEKNLQRRIEAGIGIHAGKVATGTIRLGSEDHLIVMGYPVNVASRLQDATKKLNNNFIISSTVFSQLNEPPHNKPSVTLNLKGISEAFVLHLLGKPFSNEEQT